MTDAFNRRYENASNQIRALFASHDAQRSEILERLNILKEDIELKIEALENDIERYGDD